jgi:preprotein translocase subunit SecG
MFLIYVLHIIVCVLVILVILFQDGKAGGFTAVAEGNSNTSMSGATRFLTRLTTTLATIFLITSLTLAIYHRSDERSIADDFVPKTVGEASEVQNAVDPATSESPASGDDAMMIQVKDEQGNVSKEALSDKHIQAIEKVEWKDVPEELKQQHLQEMEAKRQQAQPQAPPVEDPKK